MNSFATGKDKKKNVFKGCLRKKEETNKQTNKYISNGISVNKQCQNFHFLGCTTPLRVDKNSPHRTSEHTCTRLHVTATL